MDTCVESIEKLMNPVSKYNERKVSRSPESFDLEYWSSFLNQLSIFVVFSLNNSLSCSVSNDLFPIILICLILADGPSEILK